MTTLADKQRQDKHPAMPAAPQQLPPRFMNVRQVAVYLHVNEKKIYTLVSEGNIPATRVTGKWMFPRELVDRWLLESSHGGVLTDRLTLAGSDDPLMSRVVMSLARRVKAKANISQNATGVALGLSLLARQQADICALHWGTGDENVQRQLNLIRKYPQHHNWVMVRICMREQGLMVRPEHLDSLQALLQKPLRWATCKELWDSPRFLQEAMEELRLNPENLNRRIVEQTFSERDAASRLAMQYADIAPGTRGTAKEYGLAFVAAGWEAFDLVLSREAYFRRLFQQLLAELRSEQTLQLADELGGYQFSDVGRVVWSE